MAMPGYNTDDHSADWIKSYRRMRFHPVVGFLNEDGTLRKGATVCETTAWLDLCMEANWRDRTVNNKGRVVLIERGQLLGARNWLAQRWGWTEKKIRCFLDKLRREGMIFLAAPKYGENTADAKMGPAKGPAKNNAINVISICNYNIYQAASELMEMLKGQQEGQPGASEGPHLKKERKKEKEEDSIVHLTANDTPPSVWIAPDGVPKVVNGKRAALEKMLGGRADLDLDDVLAKVAPQVAESSPDDLWADLTAAIAMVAAAPKRKRKPSAPAEPAEYPKGFDEFWKIYPRRQAKGEAVKSWGKLTIEQRRRAYVALKQQLPDLEARTRDPKGNFCPMPSTWLNQGRFDDDPAPEFRREPAYVLQSDRHLEGVL